MRILTPTLTLGSLLTLGALTGCGNGDNNTLTPVNQTASTRDAPVTPIREEYTVTDLGATEYYYSYYGYISNRYRYNGVLRINDSGHVITNTASQPTLYDGQPRPLNTQFNYPTVNGLNNSSTVVGSAYTPQFDTHAILWSGSSVTQIDANLGNVWSVAYGINDNGAVVGLSSQGNRWDSSPTQATLWQNGQQTLLGTLGGNYSLAYGINLGGVVVGWSQLTPSSNSSYYDYYAPVHAFVWEGSTITDLGILTGGLSSDAQDINDSGQIVGSSDLPPQGLYSYRPLHAVTWINRTIQDLGTLGGPGSIAYALNNSGVIVGSADTATLAPQSTYYGWYFAGGGAGGNNGGGGGAGGGTPQNNNSPLLSGAGGRSAKIRTRGIGDTYVSHAFRYKDGTMEDLNALIATDSGWELLTATDINRNGLIVGFGKFGNKQHAFLLTPKP